MSCITSEEELRKRRTYALKRGWDLLPKFEIIDAECPYCGVDLAFEYDYEGIDETEEECPACGRTFDLSIEWEPIYTCNARKSDAD